MTSTISSLLLFSIKRAAQTLKGGLQCAWNWLILFFFVLKQLIFPFFRERYKKIPTQTQSCHWNTTEQNKEKETGRKFKNKKPWVSQKHVIFHPKNKINYILHKQMLLLGTFFELYIFLMIINHIFFFTVMPPDIFIYYLFYFVNPIIPCGNCKY